MKLSGILLLAASMAVNASAGILYSNGTDRGIHAWAVNYGYATSNSFVLAAPAHVDEIDVSLWDVNDLNNPLSADWKITTEPFGGEVVASGSGFLQLISHCNVNRELFCEWEMGIRVNADLPAGKYWFQVGNVVTRWGTWAFWGQSNGASEAYVHDFATQGRPVAIPSESFVVIGR